jgi:3',5'-cyclic AMP phosphodiesterase CpdA
MRIVHLSDIHVWRYTWDIRRLLGLRALGMMELLLGRARRFQLDRLNDVVDRVLGLEPNHIIITGDLTTTALPSEFREARRLLAPLLREPERVSMVPGNHDRTTGRSIASRRFEGTFGDCMPRLDYPWVRHVDADTAIMGLDPTRPHFTARGELPADQLQRARALTAESAGRPKNLIVACHYPVAAPVRYQRELFHKRLRNEQQFRSWLAGIGPHLYCCGHVHAAWVFRPRSLPNQLCINAGAPLMRDSTGLRLPGFMEIVLEADIISVTHHAWSGTGWERVPMLEPASPVAALVSSGVTT